VIKIFYIDSHIHSNLYCNCPHLRWHFWPKLWLLRSSFSLLCHAYPQSRSWIYAKNSS